MESIEAVLGWLDWILGRGSVAKFSDKSILV